LRHALGEFIEFVVHRLQLVSFLWVLPARESRDRNRIAWMPRDTNTIPAAALLIVCAMTPVRQAGLCAGLGFRCNREARHRHSGESEAEFPQGLAPCDRLGQTLG
jgi:hypothetical protein